MRARLVGYAVAVVLSGSVFGWFGASVCRRPETRTVVVEPPPPLPAAPEVLDLKDQVREVNRDAELVEARQVEAIRRRYATQRGRAPTAADIKALRTTAQRLRSRL